MYERRILRRRSLAGHLPLAAGSSLVARKFGSAATQGTSFLQHQTSAINPTAIVAAPHAIPAIVIQKSTNNQLATVADALRLIDTARNRYTKQPADRA